MEIATTNQNVHFCDGIEMRPVKTLLFLPPCDNSISDFNPIKVDPPLKDCPPLISYCVSDKNVCSYEDPLIAFTCCSAAHIECDLLAKHCI